MRIQTFKITDFRPGLITNISDTLNKGLKTFKNLYINSMGKLQKRKGWSLYSFGNTLNSYKYLGADTMLYPAINPDKYLVRYEKGIGNNEIENEYYITPYKVGNTTFLTRSRIDINGNLLEITNLIEPTNTNQTVISTEKVKYIETPNEIYMINPGYSLRKTPINASLKNNVNGVYGTVSSSGAYADKPWVLTTPNLMRTNELYGGVITGNIEVTYDNFYVTSQGGSGLFKNGTYETGAIKTSLNGGSPGGLDPKQEDSWGENFYVLTPIMASGTKCAADILISNGKRGNLAIKSDYNKYIWVKPAGSSNFFEGRQVPSFAINANEESLNDASVIGYTLYRTKRVGMTVDPNNANNRFTAHGVNNVVLNTNWNTDYYLDLPPLYFIADFYKDEDLKPAVVNGKNTYRLWDKVNNRIWYDNLTDVDLLTEYENAGYINEAELNEYYPFVDSSFFADKKNNMKPTCGGYSDYRLWVNDTNNPDKIFISQVDECDSFQADLSYSIEGMDEINPATAIEKIGNNTFAFTKNSITMFRPTSSFTAPYISQTISNTKGCDNHTSIAVLENIAYFINNKELWSIDNNGTLKEVGAGFNNIFDIATDDISIKYNKVDNYIYIIVRGAINTDQKATYDGHADYDYYTYKLYPRRGIMTEEEGLKDKYIFTNDVVIGGWKLELAEKEVDYKVINYWNNQELNAEFGLLKDGTFIKRNDVYTDTSVVNLKTQWDNAIYSGVTPTGVYNVEVELIKPIFFDNKTLINSVILFGTGNIEFSISTDGITYTTPKTRVITPYGAEIGGNWTGTMFYIKLRNVDNINIDLDYIAIKTKSTGGVKMLNDVGAGV